MLLIAHKFNTSVIGYMGILIFGTIVFAQAAFAEEIDLKKVHNVLSEYAAGQGRHVDYMVGSRTSNSGRATAYFFGRRTGDVSKPGSAEFLKLDDGKWYLMSLTFPRATYRPLIPVNIE